MYVSLSPLQSPYLNNAFSLDATSTNITKLKSKKSIPNKNSFKNRLLKLRKLNPYFYEKLIKIKENAGLKYSKKYLDNYLEEYNLTFKDLIS